MSHTRRKLDEAAFFRSKLLELLPPSQLSAPTAPPPSLPPEAGYYFSAFLSSARSVLWIMRYEYSKGPGWEKWYQAGGARLSEDERDLLDRFADLRNQSQKRKSAELEAIPMLVPNSVPVSSIGGVPLPGPGTWVAPSYDPPLAVIWFPVVDGQEVRASCEHYLAFLEQVVTECEERFGRLDDH